MRRPITLAQRLRMLGHTAYADYLRSPHWQAVRRAHWHRVGPAAQCAVCPETRGLQLHHRTYQRLGREEPGDLVLLCGEHHRAVHQRANSSASTKVGARAIAGAGARTTMRAKNGKGTRRNARARDAASTVQPAQAIHPASTIREARAIRSAGTMSTERAGNTAGTIETARAKDAVRARDAERTRQSMRATTAVSTIPPARAKRVPTLTVRPGPLWGFDFPGGLAIK